MLLNYRRRLGRVYPDYLNANARKPNARHHWLSLTIRTVRGKGTYNILGPRTLCIG